MSLIHEALKKVERQRQLGKAPTLDSPVYQRRSRRWLLPVLTVAVVAAAAYMVFLWNVPVQTQAGADVPGKVPAAAATTATAGTPSVAARKPEPTIARSRPATPAGNVAATAPTPEAQKARAKPGPKKPAPQTAATEPTTNGKPTAATAAPRPPTTRADKLAAALRAQNRPQKQSSATLPMYWDLPYAERKDLPEFQISMHVYASNPADRFVILNGVRQVEGDELPSGLKLVAIRDDGIVLEGDGKQFMVPRDGGY